MKSEKSHTSQPLNRSTVLVAFAIATGLLSGCATVEKGWTGTKNAVTGLFSDDDKKAAPPDQETEADTATASTSSTATQAPMTGGLFMGSGSASSAFRTSSDAAPPPPAAETPAPAEEPAKPAAPEKAKPAKKVESKEGLVADVANAGYTEQGGRRAPVTVRPLNEAALTANTPSSPPRPAAAPVERVTRMDGELVAAPTTTTTTAQPETTATASTPVQTADLAERLSAAPPSPPPATSAMAPIAPALGAAAPVAPAPMPSPVAAPTPVTTVAQPLIPMPSPIGGYGDDTIVVDSSGVTAGRNVLSPQLAGLPGARFDPGNASVSSEVGTVTFTPGSSTLSAAAKGVLADVARLRAEVNGSIRVVGRGDQASDRAASISRELRRLGVPAARLYDGGADSTMLGDEADIYLDY